MPGEKPRYTIPYRSLHPAIKMRVDAIRKARGSRSLSADTALAGLGLPAFELARGESLKPTLANISAGAALGGAIGLVAYEKEVIRYTRDLGELLASHPREVFTPRVLEALEGRGFTHAHVTMKGNLVFTREPKHGGRELIPPRALRWRMKVPLRRNP